MPLDAICLQAVVEELRPQLMNLRIDKVQQPARDQVILLLRGSRRLLLHAGAIAPRQQLFTEVLNTGISPSEGACCQACRRGPEPPTPTPRDWDR